MANYHGILQGGTGSFSVIKLGKAGSGQPAGTAFITSSDGGVDISNINMFTASYAKITELDVVTLNSITQTQENLNVSASLIVASDGAASSDEADGSGLFISGANASFTWDNGNSLMSLNKPLKSSAAITAGTSFIIGSAEMDETDLEKLDEVTNGTVAANKAVVVDGNKDASGFRNVTAEGSFIIGSADLNETDMEKIDGITDGTVAANKAVVVDGNKDASGFRNITLAGLSGSSTLQAGGAATLGSTLTVSGAISGAAAVQGGAFTGTSLALQSGGITAAGAIAGATTITSTGLVSGSGGLVSQGATTLGSTLSVSGASTMNAITATSYSGSSTLQAVGAITTAGALNVSGNAVFDNNSLQVRQDASNYLQITSDTIRPVGASLNLKDDGGNTRISIPDGGNVAINKDDGMSAIASFGDDDVTLGGDSADTLTFKGTVTGSQFSIAGTSGNAHFDGTLRAGAATLDSLDNNSGGITNAGAVSGVTTLTMNNLLSSSAGAMIRGNSAFAGTLSVSGAVSGAAIQGTAGTLTSLALQHGGITAAGAIAATSYSGSSTLQAVGATTLGSTLKVSGAATMNAVSATSFSGSSTLYAAGAATFSQGVAASGSITAGSAFIIGNANIDETDLEKLDGITNGAGAANKALVLDGNADVASGLRSVTGSGDIVFTNGHFDDLFVGANSFTIGSTELNETEMARLDGVTAGTVVANKVVTVDANKDVGSFRNVTLSGLSGSSTLQAVGATTLGSTLSVSGAVTAAGAYSGSAAFLAMGAATLGNTLNVSGAAVFGSTGQFGGHLTPSADSSYNLGSPTKRWANIYTGDLHLKNERGNWTIFEEADHLRVRNNLTGKMYKMGLTPIEE